jgi:hypothetical protein
MSYYENFPQYPQPQFANGFAFSIRHVDGYIANEVISRNYIEASRFYYVCESCAVYSESEIERASGRYAAFQELSLEQLESQYNHINGARHLLQNSYGASPNLVLELRHYAEAIQAEIGRRS